MGTRKTSTSSVVSNGLRIKGLRKQNGYSLEAFANIIGSSRSSLWRYEAGVRRVPDRIAATLKSKYKLSLDGYTYGSSKRKSSKKSVNKTYEVIQNLYKQSGMKYNDFCAKYDLSVASLNHLKNKPNYNFYFSINTLSKLSKVVDLNSLV